MLRMSISPVSFLSTGWHVLPKCQLLPWLKNFRGGKVWIAAAAALLIFLYALRWNHHHGLVRRLLWPGSVADSSFKEPLPPGGIGCPLLGVNLIAGSTRYGPEHEIRNASRRVKDARIWKTFFMGRSVAIFSGVDLVKKVNKMEFDYTDARSAGAVKRLQENKEQNQPVVVFGKNNLMFERDKERHGFLRRLVGASMTPQVLQSALPTIQKTAMDVIDREIVQSSSSSSSRDSNNNNTKSIKMEDVCVDYTMDIVQKQLLGLQLDTNEVNVFRDKLKEWLKAMYSLVYMLNIPWLIRRSPAYRAKQYIVSKLEEKVDSLLRNGRDTSTLSKMLFAVDEQDEKSGSSAKSLSREQVIENAQLLVIAGSETSAGTLALAMLLLGLHPDKYNKLVEEQSRVVATYGDELTQEILDEECPYLDAVIRETLRMGPVTAGFPRSAKQTMVIDGYQIPQNWAIMTTYRLTHQLDPVTRLPHDAHMDPYTGFVPERWFRPERTPSDFVPFGVGPRFCLGYHLSMMEMKVFLSIFARKVTSYDLVNYRRHRNNGESRSEKNKKQAIRWNPSTMIPRSSDGVLIEPQLL